ncbi:MAG: hypothetical protein QM398_12345 [Thermoproteota archaeon]|jgi:hypothetical protein|nr:hypothetical protein [Thermoproteota archaeon]NLD66782.1 hypothetical protein [Thermoproteota archaeon]
MKNTLGAVLLFLLVSALVLGIVEAANNDILGPIVIRSAGDSGTNIQILSPQNNDTSNNPIQLHFYVHASINVYGDFGDIGYSIDEEDVYRVNEIYRKTRQQHGDSALGEFQVNITLPILEQGQHTLTAYYGYQIPGTPNNPSLERYEVFAYSTVEFTVKNKDATPPEITVESPTHNTTYTEQVQLTFTLNETATWTGYSIDGNETVTIHGNNYNVTLADLTEGTHNITVYAQDQEGNIGTSENITFTVAFPKTEPFPTLTIAAPTIVALVLISLLIYFKKHKHKNTTDKKN